MSVALETALAGDRKSFNLSAPMRIQQELGFNVVNEFAPPLPPVNLTVRGTHGGIISIEWDNNSGLDMDYYRIYRGVVSGTLVLLDTIDFEQVAPPEYDDNIPVVGMTYFYAVTAVDSFGLESGVSNEVSALAV